MVEVTVPIGQLVFHVGEYGRESCGEARELVTVDMRVESRASDLGAAQTPPAVELRDGQGRVHPLSPEERRWETPLQPHTATVARLVFEVPVDATALELTLAPGTDDEVAVPLG
jgi:hypothetical protein